MTLSAQTMLGLGYHLVQLITIFVALASFGPIYKAFERDISKFGLYVVVYVLNETSYRHLRGYSTLV